MSEIEIGYATAAKTGSTVPVVVRGVALTVQIARDLTVAANDAVLITKKGSAWAVVQRLYASSITPDAGNSGGIDLGHAATGRLTVAPVETRSYRNSAWRTDNDDVYQGQYGGGGNHTGVAFYGSAPRSLAGATVTAAHIVVRRRNGGGITAPQSTTMRLVTQATRPAGAPTLGSSTAGPSLAWGATSSAFAIPTSWAQSMVDGTAGGLGFFVSSGSPYVIFLGRSGYGPAFTMTIDWSR